MQDSEIFSKTDAGRDEIRTRALHLPGAIRSILLMVDGQRSVAQFHDIIAGSKAPPEALEILLSQGLIEARVEAVSAIEAPAAEAAVKVPLPSADVPSPPPSPDVSSPAAAPAAAAAATAPQGASRFERLYATMTEVVRDFLPAHRRYFIQLKIEKCSSADELLELLQELRVSLAKTRGESFAADIVLRVRNAAN